MVSSSVVEGNPSRALPTLPSLPSCTGRVDALPVPTRVHFRAGRGCVWSAELEFISHPVLCSPRSWKGVYDTPMPWFGHGWHSLPQHSPHPGAGVGKIPGGDSARPADPNRPEGYSRPPAQIKKLRKGGGTGGTRYLYLSPGAAAPCTGALGKDMDEFSPS